MKDTEPFASGCPLQELPELTEEAFFAYHPGINKIIYLNLAFEKIWNISRDKAIADLSLIMNSVYADDRKAVEDGFCAVGKNGSGKIDFRIQTTGEKIKWIRINAWLSQKNNIEIIIGTAMDVTDIKNHFENLHQFNQKKNLALQKLSHDMLGCIGNVITALAVLNDYEEIQNNEEITELVAIISRSSNRGVGLIKEVINKELLQNSATGKIKEQIDTICKNSKATNTDDLYFG